MAGVLCEGFDPYDAISQIPGTPGSTTYFSFVTGRAGIGNALRCESTSTTTGHATLIPFEGGAIGPSIVLGFALNATGETSAHANAGFPTLLSGGSVPMLSVGLDATGYIRVYRGGTNGTQILASATPISLGTWYFIELVITLATGATGSIELFINGVSSASASAIATSASGTTVAQLRLQPRQGGGTYFDIDDIYVLDGTSPGPTTRLGDVRVGASIPHADTTSADLAKSTGTDGYALIDEIGPDGDTSYLSSDTVGHRSLFKYTAPADKTIHFARIQAYARKEDAGGNNLKLVFKSSTLEEVSASKGLGTGYGYASHYVQDDPDDGAALVTATFEAAEIGVEISA